MKCYSLILIVLILGCAEKNPYYKLASLETPFSMVFDEEQMNADYIVTGEGFVGNNSFVLRLPDSLGGENNIGEAVILIDVDRKTKRVARTSLIGIKLFNKKDTSFLAYDKFYQNNKRVDSKPGKNVQRYMNYFNAIANRFNYESIGNKYEELYCKIYFNELPPKR